MITFVIVLELCHFLDHSWQCLRSLLLSYCDGFYFSALKSGAAEVAVVHELKLKVQDNQNMVNITFFSPLFAGVQFI